MGLFCFAFQQKITAQQPLEFNYQALADLEFSAAGPASHYYYNEIHSDYTDARFGFAQLNLLGELNWGTQWKLSSRISRERELGQKLQQFRIPQLNLQWLSEDQTYGITAGRFINPFGSFNARQLSTQRNFISLPLAYSYYVNVSDKLGFYPNMGDITKFAIDGEVQWGSPMMYYGGYATGLMFSWEINPGKLNWKTALTTGASNLANQLTDPLHVGVVSHLTMQPTYYWEQGLSVGTGSFMQSTDFSSYLEALGTYRQTLIGTDFKVGSGFFEASGEIILAFYKLPVFEPSLEDFVNTDGVTQSSLATYLDLKYEPPFISGSYIAYRIDRLGFDQTDFYESAWDNTVLRQSIALGYEINTYLLVRALVSTQKTKNKSWDDQQRVLRIGLTAHY